MKLWLDDIRDPSEWNHVGWIWAKTAEQAINSFKTGLVTEASLDHDLTEDQMLKGGVYGKIHEDGCKSGYDVICWLEQNLQYFPIHGVVCHSANPAGRKRIEAAISSCIRLINEANNKGS